MGRGKSVTPPHTRACFCNATKCSKECGIGRIVAIPNGDIGLLCGRQRCLSRGMTKFRTDCGDLGTEMGVGQNRALVPGPHFWNSALFEKPIVAQIVKERPDPARKLSANLYDIYHCCVYSGKFLMMDRGTVRNM